MKSQMFKQYPISERRVVRILVRPYQPICPNVSCFLLRRVAAHFQTSSAMAGSRHDYDLGQIVTNQQAITTHIFNTDIEEKK